jgi:glycogen operon protein
MSDEAWSADFVRCLGVRLAGDLIGDLDDQGQPVVGDSFLLLLNAHHEPISFHLPATKAEHQWERVLDTADPAASPTVFAADAVYALSARSLCVLRTKASIVAEPAAHEHRELRAEAALGAAT